MSTIANDALPRTRTSRRWIWWTVGTLGVLLVVAGIWFALMLRRMADENTPPPDLDVSRSRMADENTPPPDLDVPRSQMADENTPPPDLDVSRIRMSVQGFYEGTYTPSLEPITIDKLHAWTLHLETPDGKPVENATIAVHGDMPGHGHGMPTKPIVSEHRGNGDYLVEGMKFQMPGWWFVEFDVTTDGKQDIVRFDFVLK